MRPDLSLSAARSLLFLTMGQDAEAALLFHLRRGSISSFAEFYREGSHPEPAATWSRKYNHPLPVSFWIEVGRTMSPGINWAGSWAQYVTAPSLLHLAEGVFVSVSDFEAAFPVGPATDRADPSAPWMPGEEVDLVVWSNSGEANREAERRIEGRGEILSEAKVCEALTAIWRQAGRVCADDTISRSRRRARKAHKPDSPPP